MTTLLPKRELLATMRCERGALLPCKLDWPLQRACYFGGDPIDVRPPGEPRWRDLWGVTWQKESPDPQMMPFPVGHPLTGDVDGLSRVDWPDPGDPRLFADLRHVRPTPERLLVGTHPFALYERAWLLAGMQDLLEAMADHPGHVDALFERIAAFELALAERYISLGVEAAWISDDYGMSAGLMFSPRMWRRYVRPHLEQLVRRYHDAGAVVILHSCGHIAALIDDFLDMGIDVLDPLQAGCNPLEELRRKTAGRLCLCGGISAAVLLGGDMSQTTLQTEQCITMLGADGGYIAGPDDDWVFPSCTREAMLTVVEDHRQRTRRRQ